MIFDNVLHTLNKILKITANMIRVKFKVLHNHIMIFYTLMKIIKKVNQNKILS